MFDLRDPRIQKRQRGGKGRREQLRYHPDSYYAAGIIESGQAISHSLFGTVDSGTGVACVIPLSKANGVKTITHVHMYARAASTGRANVYLYAVGGTPESAIPTGAVLDEYEGPATITAVWNDITLTGGDYAPATGSMLGLLFTNGTGGTSYQIGANSGQAVTGARVMWADTIATPIQDTVWEEFDGMCPAIGITYSDGSKESFHVSFGANSAGNTPIHGAIASGGCAGIGIQPDEDIAFNYIECYISTSGTTTSAGVARLYVYDENKNFLFKSVNTYDSSTNCFVSTGRRRKGFEFEDNILQRGSKYYIVLAQDASGGSASHYILLGGGTSTLYSTGSAYPVGFADNGYHGMWSVSSTSGVANLATNATTGHYFKIYRKPLTRTSQVF